MIRFLDGSALLHFLEMIFESIIISAIKVNKEGNRYYTYDDAKISQRGL